jgi:hypothetical protein
MSSNAIICSETYGEVAFVTLQNSSSQMSNCGSHRYMSDGERTVRRLMTNLRSS